ncbi:MAG: ATP-dependent DNA ligase [Aeropyrum sp.]|nr:ATP-dependent DNA ligase [Aeropyrum sp.]MCE4616058.1 ATP-dependent DNA ligase [Aeropyrum sp.]
MPFRVVAEAFSSMERITSRTQLTLLLSRLLKDAPPGVIGKVVYIIQGKLGPDWKGLPELGVGEKLLAKAIALAYKSTESSVDKLYKNIGDLGSVAERLAREYRARGSKGVTLEAFMDRGREELTVTRVYTTLYRIALAQGEGSRDLKLRLLAGLLADAEPIEAKYIVRFVEGRLRVGIGDATILDALAVAYGGGVHARPVIERAYNLRADLGFIAEIVASRGVDALRGVKPEVGVPIRPMLAERGRDPGEILKKVGGRAIVEYKYDGERAQIHKKGGEITIFSRRLENITRMYPDVVEMAREGLRAENAIVEGEIVAIDPNTLELQPFQVLMHRKRKHDIHRVMREVPVAVFLFDALYVDGEDLTQAPLPVRKDRLASIVQESDSWRMAEYVETDSAEEVWNFFLKAVEDGAEGVMIKAIHRESVYTAGVRGWLWVKLKRDYKSEMIDTVDLVVVGAFYGRGKRGGKLSSLLMAAYDPERDVFPTVCKVATGFTDEELDRMNEMLKPLIIPRKHPRVSSKLEPDVWVEPRIVAEILGAELTLSPLHTCCLDSVRPGVGISIRFPRFIRWRDDKRPEDATTPQELLEMYRRQLRRLEEEAEAGL